MANYFLIILLFFLQIGLNAKEIKQEFSFSDFNVASESFEKESSYLQFTVESTKVGLFSSDVPGYVLRFTVGSEYDEKNGVLRNSRITFPINSMNSDSESRDEKMQHLCLGVDQYKDIEISLSQAIFLKDSKERQYQGVVKIRGKEKPFSLKGKVKEYADGKVSFIGTTVWSLKEMEIPDPSIAVAKLSDEIRIQFAITLNLSNVE